MVIKEGSKFGRLTVLYKFGNDNNRTLLYRCKCNCGEFTLVCGSSLSRGYTRSCGCLRRETSRKTRWFKHGYARTPIYCVWQTMKQRCSNPNRRGWKNYGGRGIAVCKRWLND